MKEIAPIKAHRSRPVARSMEATMTMRSDEKDMLMMGLMLGAMTICSGAVGSLGAINYLNGEMLKAAAALILPAYLCYWGWQVRENLHSEPLIPVFSLAWLGGLPIGLVMHQVKQMLT